MPAQIEQVGKNVDACLKAGGASVKDLIGTVSYVTDVAEFSKYPDLRQRYFGSPSQWNATVPVPQLPGDALVQVEAFALIK
jgi:enamine deaminase RidA (YjgF/YER057c/UK114 family)